MAVVDVSLASRARPVSSSRDQLLPVLRPLIPVLPGGGLQRGAVIAVNTDNGASTLAFALLAAASAGGSWCAAVGTGDPGILAVAELGVDLDHLALVPWPGGAWPEVTAILLDDMDAVLVCPPAGSGPGWRGGWPPGPGNGGPCWWSRPGRKRGPKGPMSSSRWRPGPGRGWTEATATCGGGVSRW